MNIIFIDYHFYYDIYYDHYLGDKTELGEIFLLALNVQDPRETGRKQTSKPHYCFSIGDK